MIINKDILLNQIYPIGSIYMSVSSINPDTLFGGTWERMSGGYLYGVQGTPSNSSYTGTGTQGHTLTLNELPSGTALTRATSANQWSLGVWAPHGEGYAANLQGQNGQPGGGAPHTHNIAYIGVYIWKRTA